MTDDGPGDAPDQPDPGTDTDGPLLYVIGVGGEPATGKSTLMKHVLRWAGAFEVFNWGLLAGQLYHDEKLAVLGRYGEDEREGTDTLSMAVTDDVEDFLNHAARNPFDRPFNTVLYEGDRLWSDRFVNHVQTLPNTRFRGYVLDAPEEDLNKRHDARGDDQDETWLKGRRTKYEGWMDRDFIHVLHNEDPDDLDANAATIARNAGLIS